jgi:crotonobetainyl-CoA:carnitine CoA-transferase CaiB-like acyl-CoA transferase
MRPLEGMTVVSLEQAVAAPFATRQLADLGARVIKVERPGAGDFARNYDETVRGMSSHFVWLNRSKESLALDLKSEHGRDVLDRLVAEADVFVQNLAPGAAERLGFGAAQLRQRHPRLVHCSISGYGEGGPYTDKKAYDLLVQCESGLMSITGTDEAPAKVGIAVADIAAGMYAYTGVLTALLQRERSGEGATVEVSMLEALAEWMGFPLYFTLYGGAQPVRSGASHAAITPYGPFEAGDGAVFLAVQNDREWSRFCREVLARPELLGDERFSTSSSRLSHAAPLREAIEEVFRSVPSEDVLRRLETAGIANARLRDVRGLIDHPQLVARERWRTVDSPVGPLRALLPPARLDADEPVMGPIPTPGQHTAAILRELGLDDGDGERS